MSHASVRWRLTALILAVVAWAGSPVRPQAQEVRLPFNANLGDKFTVRITKKITEVKNGKQENLPPTTAEYSGEILASTPSGKRMRWTLDAVALPTLGPQLSVSALAPLLGLQGVPIEFDATSAGVPLRIIGLNELFPKLMAATRRAMPEITDARMTEVEGKLRQMDARSAAMAYLPEAVLIGGVQELRMAVGVPQEQRQKAASPIGGGQVILVTTKVLESYDPVAGIAVLTWKTEFDPDSIRQMALRLIQSAAPQNADAVTREKFAQGLEELNQDWTVTRTDLGRALISIEDGWAVKIHHHQKIAARAASKVLSSKDESLLVEVERR